jgi:polysaccharide transporter, PST family
VFAMALALGVVQGHSVYWFFGGTGNLQFVALSDLAGRILGVIAVFALVHSASQVWLIFLAQAGGAGFGVLAAILFMTIRFTGPVRPDFMGGLRLMRQNAHLFVQNFVGTIYTGSTALVMGLVSGPVGIGYFSAAERMTRAGILPTQPLRQTFFPRVAALAHEDPAHSVRLVRQLIFAAGGLNLCISLVLFFLAGFILRVVFGPGFGHSVEVLRILAVLPLLLVVQDILSNLWLIPLHHDRFCTMVVMVSGTVHVVGVVVLTSLWGPVGTAFAMLLSNMVATLLTAGKVFSLSLHPFS